MGAWIFFGIVFTFLAVLFAFDTLAASREEEKFLADIENLPDDLSEK